MKFETLGIACIAFLLSACASAPVQNWQPKGGTAPYSLARSSQLDSTSNLTQHLDTDKNIVYFQNFGGGGLAVGLLLGPLGAAANASMIESNTKSDQAKLANKIDVKPRTVFADVAQKEGFTLGDAQAGGKLTPYLYIVKIEGDVLLVAAAVIVEDDTASGTASGKYMVQLPMSYSIDQLASLDQAKNQELQAEIASGFRKIIGQLRNESAEYLAQEAHVTFRSEFVQPRFGFDMPATLISEEGDTVWLRTQNSVYALRKPHVSVKRL